MNEANPNQSRKWYRWYWSSCFAMLVPFTFFVLVAVPGSHTSLGWTTIDYTNHGWPLIHLQRSPEGYESLKPFAPGRTEWAVPEPNSSIGDGFWTKGENWNYFGAGVSRTWLWPELLVNIAVCVTTCFLVGLLFELRLRKRGRLLRVTVADGLYAMILVAIPLAFFQYHVSYAKTLSSLAQRENGLVSEWKYQTPVWLERIVNGQRFWNDNSVNSIGTLLFCRADEVHFSVNSQSGSVVEDVELTAAELERLRVPTLIFSDTDQSVVELLKILNPEFIQRLEFTDLISEKMDASLYRFENLNSLTIWSGITIFDVKDARFDKLERVHLGEQLLDTDATLEWLESLPKLKHVEAWIDNWDPESVERFRNELLHVEKIFVRAITSSSIEIIPPG